MSARNSFRVSSSHSTSVRFANRRVSILPGSNWSRPGDSTRKGGVGNFDAKVREQGPKLAIELDAHCFYLGVPKTAELIARLVKSKVRGPANRTPDRSVQWRVQHHRGFVSEHALGDDVIVRQVRRAGGLVAGQPHLSVELKLEIDEDAGRLRGLQQVDHFLPGHLAPREVIHLVETQRWNR